MNHSKIDAICGITIHNLVSGTRRLSISLRRSLLCRCGCRGWCTMYSIWSFVLWGLRALAAGAFPQARHTGAEWLVSDEVRESLAGKPLGFRGALVHIRADWAEIAKSMGMRNWNHVVRPCPFCKTPKAMLATTTGGFGPGCEPGEPTGPATYEAECRMSEIVITLSKRDRDTLLPLLAYSFTRRGRYLVRDLPDWNLAKYDVLQPGHDLWDIGQLEYVEQFPCRVVFWRQRDDAMVLHRFPLFDLPLGISLDTICIDQMHTLNLGVYQAFCLHSLWVLIKANVWRVGAHLGDRDSWALSCEHIRGELTAFYKRMKQLIQIFRRSFISLFPMLAGHRNFHSGQRRPRRSGSCGMW